MLEEEEKCSGVEANSSGVVILIYEREEIVFDVCFGDSFRCFIDGFKELVDEIGIDFDSFRAVSFQREFVCELLGILLVKHSAVSAFIIFKSNCFFVYKM